MVFSNLGNLQLLYFILLSIFGVAALIQIIYYLGIFTKLAFYKKAAIPGSTPSVSVIICAKNEDRNLTAFLPSILQQEYPDFEVVVVNDCSYDNTADILDEFSQKYNHLKIVTIKEDENFTHGKKFALMVGIKGSKNEHLLFTDADCKPQSKYWIKSMVGNFNDKNQIILGYGAYEKAKGFLNKLIRYDTFIIALQYLSLSLSKKPYMGVGRNLAYTKKLFFSNKGFASHYHIESGDDDLFINEVAKKDNTTIEIALESITTSKAKNTLKSWMQQKRRHNTTFSHYKNSSKVNLILLAASQYLFYLCIPALLVFNLKDIYLIVGIFFFRFLIQMLIFSISMKKLGEKDLVYWFPVLELTLLLFYPFLTITNIFSPKNKWKN